MSSDYFFIRWKEILKHLEQLVRLDLEFQETKAHDKKLRDAVIRLSGMLGEYISVYNATLDCLQNNLQVQKTHYSLDVVKAIINRILELKHELRKLECSNTQFLGHGLADHKLTTHDVELEDVPPHTERPDNVKRAIAEAFIKAEERRERERLAEEVDETEDKPENIWWDEDNPNENNEIPGLNQETEEMIQIRQMTTLIQAHERARQNIRQLNNSNLRRQMWEKELLGTMQPPAPLEIRIRAAKIIQKVCRAYFEIKRKRSLECEQDEVLGIRLCGQPNKAYLSKNAEVYTSRPFLCFQIKQLRCNQRKEFENEWNDSRKRLKEDFIKRRGDDFADDYRDLIRHWFRKWFDDIHYFNDIPNEEEGGSVLILKEETPEPTEWWQTYQAYLADKKANKNKSAQELKFAKMQAKQEEMMRKREEQIKLKLEAELMRKLMKNPNMHPGYKYPVSKKTEHILEVIENYRKDWDELDFSEVLEVKKKFVTDVDKNNIYAEAKMNILQTVDEDMRAELKVLRKALKTDYENNGEKFPEPMKVPKKRGKKKKKLKAKMSESIAEKLEDLAFHGILKEYPPTKLGDFIGDHNYAGDDQRYNLETALQFCGEARSIWWEKCREATHGHHKLLIVGPKLSGKTLLVHALATITDATLFELDPVNIHNLSLSSAELNRLMTSVVICARAAQPSVIYIKHIQRLFYKKVPPEDAHVDLALIKRMVTRKLLKKINHTDKITVIGSCVDPWVAKSSQLLKEYPVVVLIPDTSYSAVFTLLKHWINDNHTLPRELDINSLSYVLRGYSYGQLKDGLREFLSPDRIVKIAAHGLFPMEIYNFFVDDETKIKVEYDKYLQWYEQTQWGHKEKKHIEEQKEFRRVSELYAEKNKKKSKPPSTASSGTTT
ncbi:hypothetical protein ABMA28_001184 [Loxostege sticticalis]|uniref:ATPase AAA-type core domain-containing protein n=1 Tax=Loxostege sticticalis TaxID=481309 RepID=A0ABD0T501_LOXSC